MKGEPNGVGRYCRELIPLLIASAPEHEFIILRPSVNTKPDAIAPDALEITVPWRRTYFGSLWSRPLLDRIFRRYGRADLYHSLFQVLPVGLKRSRVAPCHVVVTLHDLIWLDHQHAHQVGGSWLAAEWFKQVAASGIPQTLRAADHVICVSDTTATRAAQWVLPERRTVVLQGVNEVFFEPAGSEQFSGTLGGDRPYLAAFGVSKPYKNLQCLLSAFANLPNALSHVRLVLIGDDGGVGALVAAANLDGRVTVTSRVNDAELRSIVARARLFVVPSLVEGFGLPALEAMALGAPVAVADTPALREVVGAGALRFDPRNPGALAAIITDVLQNDSLARSLALSGRERAATFRWSITAAKTLAVYEKLLGR
jgi:glycosyltransferase involved in cell wall biosynthesis